MTGTSLPRRLTCFCFLRRRHTSPYVAILRGFAEYSPRYFNADILLAAINAVTVTLQPSKLVGRSRASVYPSSASRNWSAVASCTLAEASRCTSGPMRFPGFVSPTPNSQLLLMGRHKGLCRIRLRPSNLFVVPRSAMLRLSLDFAALGPLSYLRTPDSPDMVFHLDPALVTSPVSR